MQPLQICTECGSFLPPKKTQCPHCSFRPPSTFGRIQRAVLGVAGGGLIAATLMACYGAAYGPAPEMGAHANSCAKTPTDQDGDCIPAGRDCNDLDKSIHPGARDTPGDGIDQDCDGKP